MGDVELTQFALAEYQAYDGSMTLDRLYDDEWGGNAARLVKVSPLRFLKKINPGTIRNPTPAMLAVLSGNINMLRFVLGPLKATTEQILATQVNKVRHTIVQDKNLHSFFYVSALTLATHLGRLNMVHLLVEAGAKVNWTWDKPKVGVRNLFSEYDANGAVGTVLLGRHRAEQDLTILASICGWGASDKFHVSDEQQSGQLDVLHYFLELGQAIDETGYAVFWEDCTSRQRDCPCWRLSTADPSVPRTPLWHTIWVLAPKLVPHAVFLIRQGTRWAPWTAWEDAPWPRERIQDPAWNSWRRPRSPLEWVLCGGDSRSCTKREAAPSASELETEQTLFMAMMEEGVERPITPDQLQFALETVIHAHSNRGFRFHPPVNSLCHKRVRYLVEKGARVRNLNEQFAKALRHL